MMPIHRLKIVVALRTNIFRYLDYSSQTQGGQEEKFAGMAIHLRWTHGELKELLEQRAYAASDKASIKPRLGLKDLLPRTNTTDGNALTYMLRHTLMRPRDAIVFVNECPRQAAGKTSISWVDLKEAEPRYSEQRLAALRDEWRDPYPDLDKLLEYFRGKRHRLDRDSITTVLDDAISDLFTGTTFKGTVWLSAICSPLYEVGSNDSSWAAMYGGLVTMLYEISFLGFAKAGSGKPT
jgi:hypothetical protein